MSQPNHRIRRIRPSKDADFDDQLWPINCALLILAGFTTGLVIATSDFGDSRLLYNGWVRLVGVGAIVGLLFGGVRWLEGRMLRRLQFCLLLSLLAHLGLAVYLHDRHLALVAQWDRDATEVVTEQYPEITLPDYYWQQIEQPQTRQSFEQPLETELPTPTEPDAVERSAQPPEILPRTIRPRDPDVPERQQPDPTATRRQEISAPRRAEAAGAQISRQPLRDATVANHPIAEPLLAPEPPQDRPPVLPDATQPRQRPESTVAIDPQRESMESPRTEHETPIETAQSSHRAEASREPAQPANPIRVGTVDRANQLTAPTIIDTPRIEAALARTIPDARPVEADVRPRETLARRDAPRPSVDVPAEMDHAPLSAPRDLTAEATRREPTEQPTTATEASPRPMTPARAERGVELPTTALAVASQPATRPATASEPLPRRLEMAADTAVLREGTRPMMNTRTASAGTLESSPDSPEVVAHAGQPRTAGQGLSLPNATEATPRLARTIGPVDAHAVADVAESIAAKPGSVASDVGTSALAALNAQDTAARRGATVRPLAAESAAGAGPVGTRGTPGPVETVQQSRVTRHESIASAVSGGGTPRPGRTAGGSAAPDAMTESIETSADVSGGADVEAPVPWQVQLNGARQEVSGPTGERISQPPLGELASLDDEGIPLAESAARRDATAATQADGGDLASVRDTTPRRSPGGIELPTTARPIESAMPSANGEAALAQGGLPNTLRILPVDLDATERTVADAPPLELSMSDAISGATPAAAVSRDTDAGVVPAGLARATDARGMADALTRATTRVGSNDRPIGRAAEAIGPIAAPAVLQPDSLATTATDAAGSPTTAEDSGHIASADLGPTSRPEGGLPVRIAAVEGPGGLGFLPTPEVGIPSRRARPESEAIHTIMRRFVVERNSGELPIDGRARESLSEPYQQRAPGRRADVAQAWGGSERTERAVELGLDFLARRQFPDGHWSLHALPPGIDPENAALGEMQSDSAATGLALLSYLGAGYTHLDDKYRAEVGRGIDWLVRRQKPDGELFTGGTKYARFYSHGIAAIALCEAYGMTRDPALAMPAQKAVDFIVNTQHATRGGWRYDVDPQTGRATETDTSVSGWMLMALVSGQMAGLKVPLATFERLDAWLDSAAAGAEGQYVYNPHAADTPEQRAGRQPSLAMTSEAMLMRMYLGYDRTDPSLVAGAEHLRYNLPRLGTAARPLRDCYFWYYATQAMFQMQGDYWTAWNERFRPMALESQVASGPLAGSWDPFAPVEDRWGQAAGRHYVTALHLLMLEVYYRHLPLFRQLGP